MSEPTARLCPSSITPHVNHAVRYCWDCQQRFPMPELIEFRHESGMDCWRCKSCKEVRHV